MHKACHYCLPLFVSLISWKLSLHYPCGLSCLQKGIHDYDVLYRTRYAPHAGSSCFSPRLSIACAKNARLNNLIEGRGGRVSRITWRCISTISSRVGGRRVSRITWRCISTLKSYKICWREIPERYVFVMVFWRGLHRSRGREDRCDSGCASWASKPHLSCRSDSTTNAA
jgi:hypothetical protein